MADRKKTTTPMATTNAAPPPDTALLEQLVHDALAKDGLRRKAEVMGEIENTGHGYQAKNFRALTVFATSVFRGGWAPKGFDSIESCAIAMAKGAELGLSHLESLSSIAVVNGRPSIWGDAMLALVLASGKLEDHKREEIGTPGEDDWGFRVRVKRLGMPSWVEETFTVEDAKRASLWKKTGPWTQYPRRMLEMRARGFALRNAFPDVLRGLISVEEASDIPPEDTPHGDDDGGGSPVPTVDPSANALDQVMALHGGGKSANGSDAPDVPEESGADDAPAPAAEAPEPEERDKAPVMCSRAQANRLMFLGAKVLPSASKDEMPAALCGLGWSWNGGPVEPAVERLGQLPARVAVQMEQELDVLVSELETAEGGAR